MDNQAVESALAAIEEQIAAIRSAIGSGEVKPAGNPMVTPKKPVEESPFGRMAM